MNYVVLLLSVVISSVVAINPIVFFPGYSLSKLSVNVTGGTLASCPTSGSFVVEYQMQPEQNGFSEECMMNYLALTYTPGNTAQPFTNRPDVSISIPGWTTGNTGCFGSPLYNEMVSNFTAKGYTINSANATFLAACYDWRMSPNYDAISGPSFMNNTWNLVKQAYAAAGNQKVWLIGHSNGPIMALYFLNQLTAQEKQQYIAGFIPISGNFAGQGVFPVVYLEGLSVVNFGFLESTVQVHRGWPANYFSGPQPSIFTGNNSLSFLVTSNPAKSFYVTNEDLDAFFTQSNNSFGLANWKKFAGLVGPHNPPGVYTYAIWGNNVSTLYGVRVPSFSNVTIDELLFRNGDGNQEDIDNESCKVWNSTMPTGCFAYWEVNNVDHFQLNYNQPVLDKIYQIVSGAVPSVTCTASTSSTGSSTGSTSSATSSGATSSAATSSAGTTSADTTSATSSAASVIAGVLAFFLPLMALW